MGEGPEKVLPAAGSRAGPWVRVTAWRSGCVEAVTQRSLFFLRFPSLRPRGCGERKVPQGGGGGTMIVKISIFRRSALVEWAPESVGSSLWVTPPPPCPCPVPLRTVHDRPVCLGVEFGLACGKEVAAYSARLCGGGKLLRLEGNACQCLTYPAEGKKGRGDS